MKKHVLAVSIAAALGAVAGAAVAAPRLMESGVGHVNLVPYFNTQGNNVTQFHIINTDTAKGKAVKVRFRGAEWSDDLFDFTVFLSPLDVFAGAIRANTTTGGTEFVIGNEASCTLPAALTGDNAQFQTTRVGSNGQAATREGYIEVITMADLVNDTGTGQDIFDAVKHANGVAPCKSETWAINRLANLTEDAAAEFGGSLAGGSQSTWMAAPTPALTTWSRIIDTVNVKSYSATATAVAFVNGTTNTALKAYFRQADEARTPTLNMTADGIFFGTSAANAMRTTSANAITAMYQYDMPDLSTPIDSETALVDENTSGQDRTLSTVHRNSMAALIAKSSIISEYVTAADVGGATDLVISQPMRRYFYTYQTPDATQAAQAEGTGWSRLVGSAKYRVTGHEGTAYTNLALNNRHALANLSSSNVPTGFGGSLLFVNREEGYSGNQIVISPRPPSAGVSLSGEVTVLSVGLASTATESVAINGKLSWANLTVNGGYDRGWMRMSTTTSARAGAITSAASGADTYDAQVTDDSFFTNGGGSLPLIGFTALRVSGSQQYGNAVPFRW